MSSPASTVATTIGFLSIVREPAGYVGGYLVTNAWGRPLEFRLTSAVQPNKVQQILYGDSLEPYLCADLIGKTLVDKTGTEAAVVITDHPAALELRRKIDQPTALYLANADAAPNVARLSVQAHLCCHAQFPDDVARLRELCADLPARDWAEPFGRVREALAEARKMGVALRAA